MADDDDGWNDSVWAKAIQSRTRTKEPRHAGAKRPGGVSIPEQVMAEFVVMRLAELISDSRTEAAIRRACARHRGNVGCWDLAANTARLRAALTALKPKWKRARQVRAPR